MAKKRVTSLDEIRAQVEPEVIEIPGFKPGAVINVAVRSVELTPHLLRVGIGNPLLDAAVKKAKEGKSLPEIEQELEAEVDKVKERTMDSILPIIDAVVKEALVEPTWDEIASIQPLTLSQKMAIFNYAVGDVVALRSFRGE